MRQSIQKRISPVIIHFKSYVRLSIQRLILLIFSDAARPLRFICIGGIAGLLQLGLLDIMTRGGWNALLANIVAFLLAAQVNFLLSSLFTWYDRQAPGGLKKNFLTLWLAFHVSISGTALLNELVFIAAHTVLPTLVASALGIACAAVVNFLAINRFVFRIRTPQSALVDEDAQFTNQRSKVK